MLQAYTYHQHPCRHKGYALQRRSNSRAIPPKNQPCYVVFEATGFIKHPSMALVVITAGSFGKISQNGGRLEISTNGFFSELCWTQIALYNCCFYSVIINYVANPTICIFFTSFLGQPLEILQI